VELCTSECPHTFQSIQPEHRNSVAVPLRENRGYGKAFQLVEYSASCLRLRDALLPGMPLPC
jgi:hypothetical protein